MYIKLDHGADQFVYATTFSASNLQSSHSARAIACDQRVCHANAT